MWTLGVAMPESKRKQRVSEDPQESCRETGGAERDYGGECPFCALNRLWGRAGQGRPEFFTHLRRAEAEVLKAFRSLIDSRIEQVEKEKKPRQATKIKVG